MSKIYVVTRGEYSDYNICAVCSTMELAKKMKAYYTNQYEDADIEEYELDEIPEDINESEPFYVVDIYKHGRYEYPIVREYIKKSYDIDVQDMKHSFLYGDIKNDAFRFKMYIQKDRAKTKEKALKIAYDKLAEELAKYAGIT